MMAAQPLLTKGYRIIIDNPVLIRTKQFTSSKHFSKHSFFFWPSTPRPPLRAMNASLLFIISTSELRCQGRTLETGGHAAHVSNAVRAEGHVSEQWLHEQSLIQLTTSSIPRGCPMLYSN